MITNTNAYRTYARFQHEERKRKTLATIKWSLVGIATIIIGAIVSWLIHIPSEEREIVYAEITSIVIILVVGVCFFKYLMSPHHRENRKAPPTYKRGQLSSNEVVGCIAFFPLSLLYVASKKVNAHLDNQQEILDELKKRVDK